ncbi:MAG TPA: hypothetical protein VNV44_01525 [Solirubrobacteraceae bacterium]|nr:hypothetical protein [Solirubrobacteraceae bacterium]
MRDVAAGLLLAAAAGGSVASSASAQLPPGVDAMAGAVAKSRAITIASPRLYTKDSNTLLLAFVVAGGTAAGEHVKRITGDGLHWSPVARTDGRTGAIEIWRARAKHWLKGRIAATLAAAAYPASLRIVAYGGGSTFLSAHAARQGRASTPSISLRPVAGSLILAAGLGEGQRAASQVASDSSRRVLSRSFDARAKTGIWLALTAARTSHVARAAGAGWSRSWHMAAVDVVVPGLKRLIEEGLLTADGAKRRVASAAALPPGCPALPAFEVGVQDDPVFLGLQPAMSPARGFELGAGIFHARLLRLNVVWGEVKRYGWAPYDRAVQMAREHCWAVHMTIMWTPAFEESEFNSELSSEHLNMGLLASFAREVAGRYAGRVGRFAIGNEPNLPLFMGKASDSRNIPLYDQAYVTAYDALQAADPGVQVIAGELAGRNIYSWLGNVSSLPSSGVGVHPYQLAGSLPNLVAYVRPLPLLVSEDGVPASEPNQIAEDLALEESARRAGVTEFVFYQLSRADSNGRFWWDTGIE